MSSMPPTIEGLPAEILHQIFTLAVLQPTNNDRIQTEAEISDGRRWPDVFDYEKGPWSVSRVCNRWRTVAVSFPNLWRYFMLGTVNLGRRGQYTALRTWLDRSGASTTGISFLIQTHGICNDDENRTLFQLLMEHSSHWENIEVINATYSFWDMMNTFGVSNRLNSLRRVTILADGEEDSYTDPRETAIPSYDVFLRAPRLSEVISRDFITFCGIGGCPKIPCAQLTTYEGSFRTTYDYHFSIIRDAPNLESLHLELVTGRGHLTSFQWQGGEIFSLSKLRTLGIWIAECGSSDVAQEEQISSEFSLFNFPVLECLSITTELPSMTAPYHSFATALRYSNCALQKLELSGCSDRPNDLTAAPTVCHLSLWDFDSLFEDTVLPGLVLKEKADSNEVLLPFLRTIELKFSNARTFFELDHPILVAMIRSRWKSLSTVAQISEVHFSFGTYPRGKVYRTRLPVLSYSPFLGDLQKEGLNVVFRELVEIR